MGFRCLLMLHGSSCYDFSANITLRRDLIWFLVFWAVLTASDARKGLYGPGCVLLSALELVLSSVQYRVCHQGPLLRGKIWRNIIHGSINLKKFMKPSFDQPKN